MWNNLGHSILAMEVGCEALSNSKKVLDHAVPRPRKTTRKCDFSKISILVMIFNFGDTFLHHFLRRICTDMWNNEKAEQICIRSKISFFSKKKTRFSTIEIFFSALAFSMKLSTNEPSLIILKCVIVKISILASYFLQKFKKQGHRYTESILGSILLESHFWIPWISEESASHNFFSMFFYFLLGALHFGNEGGVRSTLQLKESSGTRSSQTTKKRQENMFFFKFDFSHDTRLWDYFSASFFALNSRRHVR